MTLARLATGPHRHTATPPHTRRLVLALSFFQIHPVLHFLSYEYECLHLLTSCRLFYFPGLTSAWPHLSHIDSTAPAQLSSAQLKSSLSSPRFCLVCSIPVRLLQLRLCLASLRDAQISSALDSPDSLPGLLWFLSCLRCLYCNVRYHEPVPYLRNTIGRTSLSIEAKEIVCELCWVSLSSLNVLLPCGTLSGALDYQP